MKRATKREESIKTDDDNLVHVLLPVTLGERIDFRHQALDERCSVAMLLRRRLGLTPKVTAPKGAIV